MENSWKRHEFQFLRLQGAAAIMAIETASLSKDVEDMNSYVTQSCLESRASFFFGGGDFWFSGIKDISLLAEKKRDLYIYSFDNAQQVR